MDFKALLIQNVYALCKRKLHAWFYFIKERKFFLHLSKNSVFKKLCEFKKDFPAHSFIVTNSLNCTNFILLEQKNLFSYKTSTRRYKGDYFFLIKTLFIRVIFVTSDRGPCALVYQHSTSVHWSITTWPVCIILPLL